MKKRRHHKILLLPNVPRIGPEFRKQIGELEAEKQRLLAQVRVLAAKQDQIATEGLIAAGADPSSMVELDGTIRPRPGAQPPPPAAPNGVAGANG